MTEQVEWKIYHDQAEGVTRISEEIFDKTKGKLGEIFEIYMTDKSNFNFQMRGEKGWLILGGFSCGYGGEGPHGLFRCLKKLGLVEKKVLTEEELSHKCFATNEFYIDCRGITW